MRKPAILFLLLLPLFLSGQVLKETNSNGTLSDPSDFPYGTYLLFGMPGGGISYETGYSNIRQLLQRQDIDLPRFRSMNYFGVGFRFKRFYLESSAATLLFNPETEFFVNSRYTLLSSFGMISVDLGVAIWQNRNSSLILRGGIGKAVSTQQISPLGSGNQVDFNDLAGGGTLPPFPHLFHDQGFINVGVEWLQGRPKRRLGLGESLIIGYRRGIGEEPWQVVNASTVNAPLDRMEEFYFRVSFYLGVNFQKKK